jgi:hypothetical protein
MDDEQPLPIFSRRENRPPTEYQYKDCMGQNGNLNYILYILGDDRKIVMKIETNK